MLLLKATLIFIVGIVVLGAVVAGLAWCFNAWSNFCGDNALLLISPLGLVFAVLGIGTIYALLKKSEPPQV